MKVIEEKRGARTIIRYVPDDYTKKEKETPQRDLTTGGANLISMDMTEEEYNRIFKKEKE